MASAATTPGERPVSIGTILSRAFGVMGDNPVATFGIAFLFGALPQTLFSFGVQGQFYTGTMSTAFASIMVSLASMVVFIVLSMLVQAALVRATMAYTHGERSSFGESIAVGLTMAVPLIGLAILMTLGLIVALICLVIPFFIVYVMWMVAAPALVTEKVGVLEAFGRSRYLTKGARWKIFGLLILLIVISWLVSAVAGVLMLTTGSMEAMMTSQMNGGALPIGWLVISAVLTTITTAVWGTVQTSLYISLRDWKDGPQAEKLADVFA